MSNYSVILHSDKGSTWKNHKYIRKEGNKYIYDETSITPKQMERMRKADVKAEKEAIKVKKKSNTANKDIDEMARRVIRGEFGNGAERQKRLGKSYKEIQKRVNDVLLRGVKLSTSKSEKGKNKVKSKHLKVKVNM